MVIGDLNVAGATFFFYLECRPPPQVLAQFRFEVRVKTMVIPMAVHLGAEHHAFLPDRCRSEHR